MSKGIGISRQAPFLPAKDTAPTHTPQISSHGQFPSIELTIITTPDLYSDHIAASLPKQIGNVYLSYKGVDAGVLMGALFKGEADIVSMAIEDPIHSPEFWRAFFTPGNPLAVIGKAIPGLEALDMSSSVDIAEAGKRIMEEGNWVMLMQEKRLQVVAPGIEGILFSPSGQANFAQIEKR